MFHKRKKSFEQRVRPGTGSGAVPGCSAAWRGTAVSTLPFLRSAQACQGVGLCPDPARGGWRARQRILTCSHKRKAIPHCCALLALPLFIRLYAYTLIRLYAYTLIRLYAYTRAVPRLALPLGYRSLWGGAGHSRPVFSENLSSGAALGGPHPAKLLSGTGIFAQRPSEGDGLSGQTRKASSACVQPCSWSSETSR